MNRIKINGEWYIKEKNTPSVSAELFDPTCYTARVYETGGQTFEATQLITDYGSIVDDTLSLKITYKDASIYEHTEHIDNTNWLMGIHEGDKDSLKDVDERMTPQGLAELKAVILDLIGIGWLKDK